MQRRNPMSAQQHHTMCRVDTHISGVEEWFCPTCGRRFLLRWPPMYQTTVLDPGDEHATHSGSCGGRATGQLSLGISSQPQVIYCVPEETARVARAIFPDGNLVM